MSYTRVCIPWYSKFNHLYKSYLPNSKLKKYQHTWNVSTCSSVVISNPAQLCPGYVSYHKPQHDCRSPTVARCYLIWNDPTPNISSLALPFSSVSLPIPSGTHWASQVPDAPLHTCHGLITPPTLHILTMPDASLWLRVRYSSGQSKQTFFWGDASTSGSRQSLWPMHCSVYASPILFVASKKNHSTTGARLDTGGWLNLTRQGLSPCKVHQAALGALTK
jgi:hypothetical protein